MLAAVGSHDEVPAEVFWDQLHVRARSAIRELVESGETDGFGGATGACRRQRSHADLGGGVPRRRGRAASVDELVEFHNERMRNCTGRRDRTGALPSPADLVERRIIPTDPDNLPETCSVEEAGGHAHELARALEEILARWRVSQPTTVAHAY